MKLETLKDIENYWDGDIPKIVCAVVREKAIKWVKEIKKTREEGLAMLKPEEVVMIMNNITEEDLK